MSLIILFLSRGSALQRRLKEREKEMEADERDRQREKEEIEEIRRKLAEDGDPELEAQIAKVNETLRYNHLNLSKPFLLFVKTRVNYNFCVKQIPNF